MSRVAIQVVMAKDFLPGKFIHLFIGNISWRLNVLRGAKTLVVCQLKMFKHAAEKAV